jgi:thioredoxin-dependent peroxiredoxin
MIRPKMNAPDFQLFDQHGQSHKLEDYRGKWLVLYFYPKDDTPGCTKEACNFRDNIGGLRALGAEVLGISADDVDSHGKFAQKYSLNFPLLADLDAVVAKTYGAYGTKNMYGKKFDGVFRYTFLINPDGEIIKTWKKVSVEEHAQQIEAELRKAQEKGLST